MVTQGGGVAAPVGGQVLSEVLPYLEVDQGNTDDIEEKIEIEVPNVQNLTLKEAVKTLKEQGFEAKINNETEDLDKENTYVYSQVPQAGIKAYQGSCVYLNKK